MRKKLLFWGIIALSIGGVKANAQTTYTEDFENSSNVTWVNQGPTNYQDVTTSRSCTGKSYRHNADSNRPVRILQSPSFQTTGSEVNVSFDYKVQNYNGNQATSSSNFVLKLQYSTDGENWQDQYVINAANHVESTTCTTVNTTIAAGVIPSGVFSLRFETTRLDGDFYAYFDDISVTFIEPSCVAPQNISSSNIGVYTADLSWSASNSAVNNGYQVYYSTENISPNDATVLNETNSVTVDASTTSTSLTGLMASTTYYAWVRANCSDTETSSWSFNTSFTTEDSCKAPTGLSYSNVEGFSADVSWIASVSTVNIGYQVYYSIDGTEPDDTTVLNETNSVTVDASTTSTSLTGLTSATTYYYWVRANCDATDNSSWSSRKYFKTKTTCKVPSNVTISNIGRHTAEISWTESTSTVSEGYQVYYSTNEEAPNSVTVLNETNSVSVGSDVTTATLTGLTSETTYYVWVRANCDATDNSNWTAKKIFDTACETKVADYTEDFNSITQTYSPLSISCWSQARGGNPTIGYTTEGQSYWRGRDFLNDSSNTKSAVINLYSTTRKEWLISPIFDLSGEGTFELTFDYGVTKYYTNNPSQMGVDDSVQLIVSVDEGNTWTVVETWDNNNAPSNTSTTYTLDLTPYVSSHTMIAFYATDGEINDKTTSSLDYNFYVDNFAVTQTSNVGTVNQELTSLNVYPNPAKDVINISNDTQITNVEVYDINGRRLLNQNVGQTSTTIDVSSFASGTYFVKVTAEGKTSTKQILVK